MKVILKFSSLAIVHDKHLVIINLIRKNTLLQQTPESTICKCTAKMS